MRKAKLGVGETTQNECHDLFNPCYHLRQYMLSISPMVRLKQKIYHDFEESPVACSFFEAFCLDIKMQLLIFPVVLPVFQKAACSKVST